MALNKKSINRPAHGQDSGGYPGCQWLFVDQFGATSSRLIFCHVGAMSAVQPPSGLTGDQRGPDRGRSLTGALAGVLADHAACQPPDRRGRWG